MRNRLFLAVGLIIITGFGIYSQTYVTQAKPADNNEWGYLTLKSEFISEQRFTKCSEFSKEGYAAIYDPEKKSFYFIDLKGQILPVEITGFKLITVILVGTPTGFSDGFAPVGVGKKWGYINTSGKVAIPVKFDKVLEFQEGYSIAKIGEKYFILNTKLEEIPVNDPGIVDIKRFSGGLAPFKSDSDKEGFINEKGEVVIQAGYLAVGYFKHGLAWAKNAEEKIGYIDKNGNWIIQPQFKVAKDFDPVSGLAMVTLNDKKGFVNKSGEMLYVNDAESTGDFSEGLCWGRKNDKIGFFDHNGQWVIQPQFDAVRDFKNGYAAVRIGEKWGIIDTKGNIVIKPEYFGIKDMELVQ